MVLVSNKLSPTMPSNYKTTSNCNLWTFLRRPTPVLHMDVDCSPPPTSAEPTSLPHSPEPSSPPGTEPPHSPPNSPPGTPELDSPTYFPQYSSPSSPSNPPSVPPISPVSEYYVGYSDYEDEEEDRLNIAYLPSPPTYLPERFPAKQPPGSFSELHPSTDPLGPQHPKSLPSLPEQPLPGLLPLPTPSTLPEPPCINCGSISSNSSPDISPLLNPPPRMDRPTLLNIPSTRPTLPPLNIPSSIPSSPFLSPSSPLDAPFAALSLTSPPPVRRKLRSTRRKSTLSSEQRAVLSEFDAVERRRWSAAERRRIAKCAGVSELNVFEWFSSSK
eukprot:sb/3466687/